MKNRLVLLTGVVLIVMGGVAFPESSAHTQTFLPINGFQSHFLTEEPTAKSTPVSTADWKTFTNDVYGFSIMYPLSIELQNPQQVEVSGGYTYIPLCDFLYKQTQNLIMCFYLPEGTYPATTSTDFDGASLAVSIVDLNPHDCLSFADYGVTQPGKVSINGINFLTLQRRGGGLGHGVIESVYRVFIDNFCFGLTSTIAVSLKAEYTVWTSTPAIRPFTDSDMQQVQGIFDQMLSTLHFSLQHPDF